jgi:hypothetical protein
MIIRPVMMRSTLSARGAQAAMVAAIVSIMNVSPDFLVAGGIIGIATQPPGKAVRHKKIRGLSHGSNGIMRQPKC